MAEPLAYVEGPPADQLFVADDDLVFATRGEKTSSGAIYRVSRSDGTAMPIYRGLADYPSIAVRPDGAIVVADSSQPNGCSAEGNAGVIFTLAADGAPSTFSIGRRCVASLAATSTELAWIEDVPHVVFSGDAPKPAFALLPSSATPFDAPARHDIGDYQRAQVLRDGETLLWLEGGTIMQRAGGTTTMLAGTTGFINAFAFDATDIVYVSGNTIMLRPRASGTSTMIGSSMQRIVSLALDPSFVFVSTETGLSVIDRQSGAQRDLALGWFQAIAQDEQYIYGLRDLATRTEVTRIRKPALPLLVTASQRCEEPTLSCGTDVCIDTSNDVNSCGGCDHTCASSDACEAGTCVCAPSSLDCSGTCVDPGTDANNCGACGRSCNGGDCVGGDCLPHKIASFARGGIHDAIAVYFAVGAELRRIDKATLSNTLVGTLPGSSNDSHDLAQDSTRLFIATYDGTSSSTFPTAIYSLLKAGTAPPTALYPNRLTPRHIAVVPNGIVWVETDATTKSKLIYAAADGSGVISSFTPTNLYTGAADDQTADLVTVGSTVYWLLGDTSSLVSVGGAVVRVDLAAAQPVATLVTQLAMHPYSLAVVGDELYISAGWPDGKILSMPLAGGQLTTIAQGLLYPSRLTATPEGGVMWIADDFRTAVYEREPGMSAPRIIQSGNDVELSSELLVDSDRIFSTSLNGVFVMRR